MQKTKVFDHLFVYYGKKLIASLLFFSLFSSALQAAEIVRQEKEEADTHDLNEIIVTGEKTDRSLKRTPGSVTVISGQDIQNRAENDTFSTLLQGAPNLLYTSTASAPVIRGIDTKGPLSGGNTFLSRPIPRATISLDGRYLSAAEFGLGGGSVWDVNSVELFRGPQTTSQGANSIAGAVIVKTNDPEFIPSFDGQVLYGSYHKKRASFAAGGPLSDDFAVRLAMDYSSRNSFINHTNPRYFDADMDKDFTNVNARIKMLWQPMENPGFKAKLTYAHSAIKSPDSESASQPYQKLQNTSLSSNISRTRSDAGIFDLQYEFDNESILANQFQYSSARLRYTFTKMFPGIANRDSNNISNETRLNFGNENSTWSGMAGVYYSQDTATNVLDNSLGKADADLTHSSLGIFSEIIRRFAQKWALTGGLRYQYDRIQHKGNTSYVPGVDHNYQQGFAAVLPKISLAYDITDEMTVGTLISRGYAPGGTGVNFSGHSYYTFSPESAWNYELFVRANALNKRLLINGNLFYTDYKDFQSSVTDYTADRPNGSILVNADKAVTYGLELAADYHVINSLHLRGGLGLLHTEIKKFTDYRGNAFEGKSFAKAPGYMFNLGADWDITDNVRLSSDIRYVARYFSNDQNAPELRTSPYAISNLRLAYSPDKNIELFTFGNNVFDRRVPTSKSKNRGGDFNGKMLDPREIGVGVKVRF